MTQKTISLLHPAKLLGTWFGVGLVPKAPGTFGSLAALPFAWIIQSYWGHAGLLIASVIAFFAGWAACHYYLPYADTKDPKELVIDEVSGQWLLLSFVPLDLTAYTMAFALFRFFDICKPWPISLADRKIGGGFGVMIDDTIAALYPVVLFLIVFFVLKLGPAA